MSDDEIIADIINVTHKNMRASFRGYRGQIVTPQDSVDWWPV